jgi:hypothetical protein
VQVAGLGSLLYPVAGWAAVPDVGARRFRTRPSLPGAHATIRWSRAATAGRPQDSCLAPQRDLLVRRPGRPDEHLATRPHHRQFANPGLRTNRSATPTRVPDGEARPSPLRPALPISDRPTDRRRTRTAPTPPTRAHRATTDESAQHERRGTHVEPPGSPGRRLTHPASARAPRRAVAPAQKPCMHRQEVRERAAGQPSAAETTSRASSWMRARWSGPRKLSA